MPVLNMKGLMTERVAMEVVPRKGNNEYAGSFSFLRIAGEKLVCAISRKLKTHLQEYLAFTSSARRVIFLVYFRIL